MALAIMAKRAAGPLRFAPQLLNRAANHGCLPPFSQRRSVAQNLP
jgi:hypothetical protein